MSCDDYADNENKENTLIDMDNIKNNYYRTKKRSLKNKNKLKLMLMRIIVMIN